jgi:hypothetical protein
MGIYMVMTHNKALKWVHYHNLTLLLAMALGGCFSLVTPPYTNHTSHKSFKNDPLILLSHSMIYYGQFLPIFDLKNRILTCIKDFYV